MINFTSYDIQYLLNLTSFQCVYLCRLLSKIIETHTLFFVSLTFLNYFTLALINYPLNPFGNSQHPLRTHYIPVHYIRNPFRLLHPNGWSCYSPFLGG